MHLQFPELGGGPVQGLNDAGVENFQGAIDVYLSRECGQNSGDAHAPGVETVLLEFQRLEIAASSIPGFEQLKETLKSCLEKWGGKPKEREFFETALKVADAKTISVLKISDEGTTGLTGDDDEDTGRWFALVKSQGVSNKENTAGGSFGIGKSSPFAASRFRTVFYGTKTAEGDVALQGVSRLVTHKNGAGKLTQGVGFIGDFDAHGADGDEPLFKALRDPAKIPPAFLRSKVGTDIWVIGYRSGEEWQGDLVRSLLTNFWPAVARGQLRFRVGDQEIDRENIEALIQKHRQSEEFDAHHFFKAMSGQPIRKKLKHVGDCELFLTTDGDALPRRICMARASGMRIYDYAPRACRVPFSGLFICTDDKGNRLLRNLEPPKHDTWDAKRVEGSDGKAALNEIKGWIRDEVKKLNPLFTGNSFNENELAKYLEDMESDGDTELAADSSDATKEESLESKPKPDEIAPLPVKARPVSVKQGKLPEGGFGTDGDDGKGGKGAGKGTGGAKKKGGAAGGDTDLPPILVRSFHTDARRYEFIVRSADAFQGKITILAVGEDGVPEEVSLVRATMADGAKADLRVDGGIISGVSLSQDEPLRITLELEDMERRSLTAVLKR